MNMDDRDEEILQTLEDLRELSLRLPVLVEGKKDRRALRGLGLRGKIVRVQNGSSIFELCETLARDHKEVVLLTDWDRRGGQLCRLLREGLAANGVRYNTEVRARLARLTKKEVKDVEGLPSLVERIRPPRPPRRPPAYR